MGVKQRVRAIQAAMFSPEASAKLAEIIQQNSGISIKTEKNFLIQTRLQNRLTELNISDLHDYVALLRASPKEIQICVELLTTHKTEWFREIVHFQWLKSELKKRPKGAKPFLVWSAACSSGAEVYSLLFLLLKEGLTHTQIRILGTDISLPILDRAKKLPEEAEFQLQKDYLIRSVRNKAKIQDELNISLKQSVKFKQFNLIKDQLILPFQFDVIFLRNVLIYFDRATVLEVCKNISRYLKPNGYLVIGISESLHDEIPEFVSIGNSVYQYRPRGSK